MTRATAASAFSPLVSLLIGAMFVAGCRGDGGPPAPGIQPSVTRATHQLTGTVTEVTQSGPTGVPGASVNVYVEDGGYFRSFTLVRTDGEGRYVVEQVPEAAVIVVAYTQGDVQPCAATGIVTGRATIDVRLVPEESVHDGTALFDAVAPTLSGTVFEPTHDGFRPAEGARLYVTLVPDLLIAETVTGNDGRYIMCHLPATFRVTATKPGFSAYGIDVELRQTSTVLDLKVFEF